MSFQSARYSDDDQSEAQRARNAASAKRSRERKRVYVSDIEQKLSLANEELEALRRKTHDLENRLSIVNKDRDRILTELAEAVVDLRREKEKGTHKKARGGDTASGLNEKLLLSPIFCGGGVSDMDAIESHFF